MSKTQNTSFLTIPYSILNLEGLTLSAKVLLAEILSLSKLEGYCYASNAYLAKRVGISHSTAKGSIQLLKKLGYINIKTLNFNERFIYPNQGKICPTPSTKNDLPPGKKCTGGRSIISHNNNINYNNNYKENRKNAYLRSDKSYDIYELMKIK